MITLLHDLGTCLIINKNSKTTRYIRHSNNTNMSACAKPTETNIICKCKTYLEFFLKKHKILAKNGPFKFINDRRIVKHSL